MNRCDQFQAQLLDHLYGLLDPGESQALAEHLDQCAACRAALAQAEQQQKLLAAAAKAEFAQVCFQAPAAEPAASRAPGIVSLPPARKWVRWAVAAGIILAAAGLGLPGGLYWQQHQQVARAETRYDQLQKEQNRLADQHKARTDEAQQEIDRISEEIRRLAEEQQQKLIKAQAAIQNRQIRMAVIGPETLEPGALNTYEVKVQNRWNQPVAARVSAQILDQDKKVVYEVKDVQSGGDFRFTPPRDLPLRPNSDFSLVVSARAQQGQQVELTEKLKLATPLYVTHLATDKPMYLPGETVHFRSLTLERFSLKPAQEDLHLVYTITKPTGERVQVLDGVSQVVSDAGKRAGPLLGPDTKPIRGIGAGAYQIGPDAKGGEYALTVSEASQRFQPQERKFLVNTYQKPRLNKELEFTKKSYGPSETVVAACKVARAEGRLPVANTPVQATVRIDGKTYAADGKETARPILLRTDPAGAVNVRFQLPARMEKGEGSLSVAFNDGSNVETIVRSIPIVLKKLQVEFFPEGGDLVAGLPNRVYFQARTTLDKPAELKGRVVDDQGQVVVANVATLNDATQPGANQGMGRFVFTPRAGKQYELKIDAPAGMEGRYVLPKVIPEGVVLSIPDGVTNATDPIRVVLHSGKDRSLLVGAYCRGRLMGHEEVEVKQAEEAKVELHPDNGVGGVYRVTVFEEQPTDGNRRQLLPRAERLIYRKPAERLNLTIQPDKSHYVPGDKVKLVCVARNEKEQPAPAVLMVAVTDKSVLKLADEKTFRTMPTHFLLTTEVRRPEDLEHADFLLSDHANAAEAVDLLLGTQGWRRFAEQNPNEFRQHHREEAERLLVNIGQLAPNRAPKVTDFDRQEIQKVYAEFTPQLLKLRQDGTAAKQKLAAAEKDESFRSDRDRLEGEIKDARAAYVAQVDKFNAYRELAAKLRAVGLPVLAAVLLLAGVASLLLGLMRRHSPQALPYLLTAACSILLFGFVATYLLTAENQVGLAKVYPKLAVTGQAAGQRPDEQKALQAGDAAAAEKEGPALLAKPEAMPAPPPMAPDPGVRLRGAPAVAPGAPPLPHGEAAKGKADLRDGMANQLGLDLEKKAQAEAGKDLLGRFLADKNGAAKEGKRAGEIRRLNELGQREQAQKMPPQGVPGGMPAARAMPQGGAGLAGFQGGAGFGGFQGGPFAGGANQLRGDFKQRLPDFGVDRALAALPPPLPAPLLVREYAHQHTHGTDNARSDFTETVYWNPVLVLPDGQVTISFDLCDSVTTFQVSVAGHTLDGRLAAVATELRSEKPFTLQPKLPVEVTAGDEMQLPVAIANNTDAPQSISIRVHAPELALLDGRAQEQLSLQANERTRRLYRFKPTIAEGEVHLEASGGRGEAFGDQIQTSFQVVPQGFPIVGTKSDLLEKLARIDNLVLPEKWIEGSLKCQVAVYPSTLADLQKGLEALLREPNGCFEQTSTSNYPNLLILDYLKETDQAKPELARRAKDLVARGYEKLTSFECLNTGKSKREGYEWFGGTAPAHEALTAYGLLEFRDMARVHDVDKDMLERTRQYLMSRKDGKGGFLRNPRALDTFGRAPDNITNAYIVWALTESSKQDDVARELDALGEQAKSSTDPYFLALVGNSLLNRDRTEDGIALLKKLAETQKPDGHVDAAQTSITGSGGRDLQIETTALSVYAWLKAQRPDLFNKNIQSAIKWIGQQRGGYGGFGSTQSTILALKALIAYAKANKKTAEEGDLVLYVGDKELARQHFAAGAEEAIVVSVPEPEKQLKPGNNKLRLEITGKSAFPYTASWSYQTEKPPSAENCPVVLNTKLDRQTATEGETVSLTVKVENKSGKGQGMTVAIIGLPAGLTLPEDLKQLKDLARLRNDGTERGPIDAFETRGRELILYWRDLAPDKKVEVHLDLICRVPGKYKGPASRAYLYYNADTKCWVEPLSMEIAPAKKGE